LHAFHALHIDFDVSRGEAELGTTSRQVHGTITANQRFRWCAPRSDTGATETTAFNYSGTHVCPRDMSRQRSACLVGSHDDHIAFYHVPIPLGETH